MTRIRDGAPRRADPLDETCQLSSPSRTTLPAAFDEDEAEDWRIHLIVLMGNNVGRIHTLNLGLSTIGRDDDCAVQILDAGISRHHAMIYCDARQKSYSLRDLGSTNGTSVNGTRVTDTVPLVRGDKIQLGVSTSLRVSCADEPEMRYAKKMYEAVLRDGLTGAFNRRYLDERLTSEVAFARRHQTALSLLLFDIDRFKRVNDEHGHPAGDAVLRQLAERVTRAVRSEDVLARYGGEEFAVLCRDITEENGALLAERLRSATEAQPFQLPEGHELPVTISIGVAELGLCGADDGAALVDAADDALYSAKDSGRNRVVRASQLLS